MVKRRNSEFPWYCGCTAGGSLDKTGKQVHSVIPGGRDGHHIKPFTTLSREQYVGVFVVICEALSHVTTEQIRLELGLDHAGASKYRTGLIV